MNKKQISLQITQAIHNLAKIKAKNEGLSTSAYIEQLIRKDLKEEN